MTSEASTLPTRQPAPSRSLLARVRAPARGVAGNWFALPAFVLISVLVILPFAVSVWASFNQTDGSIGLANYGKMLSDKVWWAAIGNLGKAMLTIPIFVLGPLALAYMVFTLRAGRRFGGRAADAFLVVVLFAYVVPPIITGLLMGRILVLSGLLNSALRLIGLDFLALPWLSSEDLALWSTMAVVFWSWTGLGVVIYSAGLTQLPQEQLDAARVDGAGGLSLFRHVVIPNLLPTVAYWTVLVTSSIFFGLIGYVFSLTSGGPGYATMLPEYYIWTVSTKYFEFNYGSALGITLFLVLSVVTLIQFRLTYGRAEVGHA